jgi:hypothetical protein
MEGNCAVLIDILLKHSSDGALLTWNHEKRSGAL